MHPIPVQRHENGSNLCTLMTQNPTTSLHFKLNTHGNSPRLFFSIAPITTTIEIEPSVDGP
jgi:hypothetical protein